MRPWYLRRRATSGRSRSQAVSVFFYRDALAAEEPAHHAGIGLHAAFGGKAVAQRLQRDVGLLKARRLNEAKMRRQNQGRCPPVPTGVRWPVLR